MASFPYGRFPSEELTLRDYLALGRTVPANERTFLSYVRTALAFAGEGVALIHFVESSVGEAAAAGGPLPDNSGVCLF